MRTVKVIICVLLLAACSSSKQKLDLGGSCSLNSDCQDGLLCKFGACHKACVKSIDCATGERCVQVDGVAVCQLVKEQACDQYGNCQSPLVCRTVDNTCRNKCTPIGNECLPGQTCSGNFCVENAELQSGLDAGAIPDSATPASDTAAPNPDVPTGGDATPNRVDAASGEVGLGTVVCPQSATVTIHDSTLAMSVVTEGQLLKEVAGLAFSSDGRLLASNSPSWFSSSPTTQGEILSIDSLGRQTVVSSSPLLQGPGALGVGPAGSAFAGNVLVAVEDLSESGKSRDDGVVRFVGTDASLLTELCEPWQIAFGNTGFGPDLFVVAREQGLTPPSPYRIYRVTADGVRTPLTIKRNGREITGIASIVFSASGEFRDDLLLSTFIDDRTWDSTATRNSLLRVTKAGEVSTLLDELPFSPTFLSVPTDRKVFPEPLYFTDNSSCIFRVSAAGQTEVVVSGLSKAGGMTFGPDGMLYIGETARKRILRFGPR